ncbi:MAG: outer membrane beta-barrel protein, partial [Flavobacteriales bacterium]|nr:outer membrane beta-barrel protein [Flavobacteriales bacterium]
MKSLFIKLILVALIGSAHHVFGQNNRAQYNSLLKDSYFEVNFGYINYPFGSSSLEDGYTVESVEVPHASPRIVLYGHNFNKYLSAQISYTRPIFWVRYNNIDGPNGYKDSSNHPVFMNIGGLTAKGTLPIGNRFSIYGEAGLAIITRTGFHEKDDSERPDIVTDANYGTLVLGAGLNFHISPKWALKISSIYSPANERARQPYTVHYGFGFSYTMRELSEEDLIEKAKSKYIFPENIIQIGYSTNEFGYGVNDFFSEGAVPVFWGGNAHVVYGFTALYQRNIFHGTKTFSLDIGSSFSYWKSQEFNDEFITLAIFPVFKFVLLHTKPFDLYFNYSLAGPAYISGLNIDGRETGPQFTFQDFMGTGFFIGKE